MPFTYNGITITLPHDYTKGFSRVKIGTKIRSDLYKDIQDLSERTNREITKIFDCLILELQSNPEYFKSFMDRLQKY